MMRWSIPDWFFEGDAITMETALTKGGRGRIPAFAMNIRAFSIENTKYIKGFKFFNLKPFFHPLPKKNERHRNQRRHPTHHAKVLR